MADQTINFNLKKPGQEDFYNVEDFNANADIVDAQLKILNDKTEAQTGSITTLQNELALLDEGLSNLSGSGRITETVKGNADALTAHLAKTMLNGVHGIATTSNMTYYVDAATGNNNNDGLAAGRAFKTIMKAILAIPQIVNHDITINVAPGTYDESVSLRGFLGKGTIFLYGDTTISDSRVVNWVFISRNACRVDVRGFCSINTSDHAFSIVYTTSAFISYCKTDASTGSYSGMDINNAFAEVYNCSISNRNSGIRANKAVVYSNNNAGIGNVYGIRADNAGTIGKDGTQPSGTTAEMTSRGGEIR